MQKTDRSATKGRRVGFQGGFTLLELIVAFVILALFVLPMLEIVAAARVRATRYTHDRMVRDLAQRKLFERVYSIELLNAGTFEAEGHPEWTWEISEPELAPGSSSSSMESSDSVLLQYTIRVTTPQMAAGSGGGSQGSGGSGNAFEMSTWAFPSQEWKEEQEYLRAQGFDTGMGLLPGGLGGY